jgi:hypothetical protein
MANKGLVDPYIIDRKFYTIFLYAAPFPLFLKQVMNHLGPMESAFEFYEGGTLARYLYLSR